MNSTSDADPDTGENAGEAHLTVDGISKDFGGFTALNDVDLAVGENEIRSIIGPNGAGKTTLFNIIAGMLPPTDGCIRLRDEDITDLPPEQRAHRGIGRSYQSNQLFYDETVVENVRIALQTSKQGSFSLDVFSHYRELYRDRAYEILKLFELMDEDTTTAKNLSHGDQRRLSIAIALATEPEVLLLDEPTSGMGPEATSGLAGQLRDIHEQFDLTTLLVEHDMSVVLDISDRITVLNNGTVLATDTPTMIQRNDEVQEAYLGGTIEEGTQ